MKKLVSSFGYAFTGLRFVVRTQLNFRIHLAAALLAVAMGWYLHISKAEWLWIMLSITVVLAVELMNTAIEILTDIVSPEHNKKAGIVKDVAAAAVVTAALFALVVGLIVFLPKLVILFF